MLRRDKVTGKKFSTGLPVIFLVGLCAVGLRFLFLGSQSLWMDEAFSYWMGGHPIGKMFAIISEVDSHPPLFYSFLHLWMMGGNREAYLRLPFALCGIINCAAIYFLTKNLLCEKTALLVAIFWTCSFMALDEETQIRMYAPAVTFTLFATLFFWKAFQERSAQKWFLYLLFSILSIYTHYYAGFVILSHELFLLLRKRIKAAFFVFLSLFIAFLPWLPSFVQQFLRGESREFPPVSWHQTLLYPAYMLVTRRFSYTEVLPFISIFAAGIALFGCVRLGKKKNESALLLFLLAAIPSLLPFGIASYTSRHIFAYRYLILFAPYYFLLFVYGLFHLQIPIFKRILAPSLFIFLILVNTITWIFFLRGEGYQRQNWREAAKLIRLNLTKGDTLFVKQGMSMFPLAYYLPDLLRIRWKRKGFQATSPSSLQIKWFAITPDTPDNFIPVAVKESNRQWLIICQDTDPEHKTFWWLMRHQKKIKSYELPAFNTSDTIYVLLFAGKTAAQGKSHI